MSNGAGANKTSLLILHASYGLGGAERVLQQLAVHLHAAFDLSVLALYQAGVIGEQMRQQGVSVHALEGRSRTDPRVLPRFLLYVKRLRPNVLLTVDSPYALFHAVLAKRLGLTQKLVVAVHSFGKIKRTREMQLARRFSSGYTDVLVALSETHRRFLCEREGWRAQQVIVIPNGVDIQWFSPEGAHLRKEWGLEDDTPSLGIVAGLRPEKNLFLFLQAAQHVIQALPEARAFIVGDGALRNELIERAQALGIASQVVFTGALENIPDVWRTLDVAVLTSRTEVLPMTLIEAAACATPAISTDVGAVRDVVIDGQTGFVVPPNDEHALAERILFLLQNPTERQRMGQNARRHAETHFDLRQMIRRYTDVLSLEALEDI